MDSQRDMTGDQPNGRASSGAPVSLLEYLTLASDHLNRRGIENARLNAERMLAHVLSVARIELYLRFDQPLKPEEVSRFRDMLRRRSDGEPLQYLLGSTEFYGREFLVNPDVLIPRPETETLVETVIERVADARECVLADIGTGSGCIAITLAAEIAESRVLAVDISPGAVALAKENADCLGIANVEWFTGNLTDPLGDTQVDVLVSNPPYVSENDRETLQIEVRDHEPALALYAGKDGLTIIRDLIQRCPRHVKPGGFAAFEIGMGQADAVVALWNDTAPDWAVEVVKDLAEIDRIVIATRPT
jgi:release factor glutamine methyltransferase